VAKIIECVPNISEGRNPQIVEAIVDAVRSTPGVTLLDHSSDASHNRSVITFIGDPKGVVEAAVRLAKKAAELIDLTVQSGEHPRMGAVDVIPFIPLREATLDECVDLSKEAGRRIAQEAEIPVFLYEKSASSPERANLANIRKGQFEGMAEKVQLPDWAPDFGGRRVHPTAGVVAVGARIPLIAFNINLSTDDVSIAKRIARIIRESSGGLASVKALGVLLEERKTAQVTINMTDYRKTPFYRVIELVRAEAARWGVHIVGTEIVGLTPMRALTDTAAYYMQLEDFDPEKQVLETHLL